MGANVETLEAVESQLADAHVRCFSRLKAPAISFLVGEEKSMNWEKATQIAYEIGKSKLAEERMDLFRKAAEYARIRVDWQLSSAGERPGMDENRRRLHDAFIGACDDMGRVMEAEGEDASWRVELGADRKEIGDFACYIHLILGLVAR